jgi:DNA repair protein RadC
MKISDIPIDERPRERLMQGGAKTLCDSHLLAIILGSGTRKTSKGKGKNVIELAEEIFTYYNPKRFLDITFDDLIKINGINTAKACSILASIEFVKRIIDYKDTIHPVIEDPEDVAKQLFELGDYTKEHFVCLYLNGRNQIIKREVISVGILDSTLVHPREIFEPAIKNLASSVILAHNHPSGDLKPSDYDVEITKQMMEAGRIMGIEVLDHVIISKEGYVSLKDKGLI